jgi:polysaccharide pyruvyl transferase WcaK-like protein
VNWRGLLEPRTRRPAGTAPRVGLFGLFGSGNLGNDASFDVMYTYLRERHPDAAVDAMCMGPERVRERYGIDAIPILWFQRYEQRTSGATSIGLKMVGKGFDALRTAAWVRRHEAVIVPGTGILEASLPLRASGTPYAVFLVCASGWLFGTKVGFVSVGATTTDQRLTRWLFAAGARLASYRSYRDETSRDAMRQRGVDTTNDHVCPDLVFGLRASSEGSTDDRTVGVGVMEYYGGSDDRAESERIHARYVDAMQSFVRWLVDTGHRVRLFWGDDVDRVVVEAIEADLETSRPDLAAGTVMTGPLSSLQEIMDEMAHVGTVVGIRYHNVVAAVKLSKPTISIGYCEKHDELMADMGLSGFTQSAQSVDVDRLIAQFQELERRAPELRQTLAARNEVKAASLDDQFARMSSSLLGSEAPVRVGAGSGRGGASRGGQ